jgi:hypothetical protein
MPPRGEQLFQEDSDSSHIHVVTLLGMSSLRARGDVWACPQRMAHIQTSSICLPPQGTRKFRIPLKYLCSHENTVSFFILQNFITKIKYL